MLETLRARRGFLAAERNRGEQARRLEGLRAPLASKGRCSPNSAELPVPRGSRTIFLPLTPM
jgi:hypothetical protein